MPDSIYNVTNAKMQTQKCKNTNAKYDIKSNI